MKERKTEVARSTKAEKTRERQRKQGGAQSKERSGVVDQTPRAEKEIAAAKEAGSRKERTIVD